MIALGLLDQIVSWALVLYGAVLVVASVLAVLRPRRRLVEQVLAQIDTARSESSDPSAWS